MKPHKSALREPPVYVVLADSRGIIIDVNAKDGRSEASKTAASSWAVGDSYFDHCHDDDQRLEIQSLLKRKRSLVSFVLAPRPPKQKRWFVVVGVPVSAAIGSGAVLMHIDISAWVPEAKDGDGESQNWQTPVTLNPALIQDTIAKALVKQFGPASTDAQREPRPYSEIDSLSPRQREVLALVGAGKSNLEIAAELSCSLNTVKRHVTAVLQKLHLPNRTRAAMLANRLNLGPGDN